MTAAGREFHCAHPGCTATLRDPVARTLTDRLADIHAILGALVELTTAGWGWDSGRQVAWCPDHKEAHAKACRR